MWWVLMLASLWLPPPGPGASAKPSSPTVHKTAKAALQAWRGAVESGDAKRIADLVAAKAKVEFRAKMVPGAPPKQQLDRAALLAALKAGKGNLLGLDKGLHIPTSKQLRKAGKAAMEAKDKRCPEVLWRFEDLGAGGWQLTRVVRTLLDC